MPVPRSKTIESGASASMAFHSQTHAPNTCRTRATYFATYFATYWNTTYCKVAKWRWTSSIWRCWRSRHSMKRWPCRKPGSAADLHALPHSPLSKTSAGRSFVWQFGINCSTPQTTPKCGQCAAGSRQKLRPRCQYNQKGGQPAQKFLMISPQD